MLPQINLHVHTNYSDGLTSPEKTVSECCKSGLKIIAITDHDTVEGVSYAKKKGEELGVEVISGVELSLEVGDKATCHLLGYLFNQDDLFLRKKLKKISLSREDRNREILSKLREAGLDMDYSEIVRAAGKTVNIGRLHIAEAMLARGFVKNHHEAFVKYIAKGRKAYAPRYRPGIKEGIEMIHGSGGVAVLAHPGEGYTSRGVYQEIFNSLVDNGLDGIEVYYPSHTHIQIFEYSRQAKDYGLIMTAGTDYHGIPGRDMLKFNYDIDYNIIEKLKERGGIYAHTGVEKNARDDENFKDSGMD